MPLDCGRVSNGSGCTTLELPSAQKPNRRTELYMQLRKPSSVAQDQGQLHGLHYLIDLLDGQGSQHAPSFFNMELLQNTTTETATAARRVPSSH